MTGCQTFEHTVSDGVKNVNILLNPAPVVSIAKMIGDLHGVTFDEILSSDRAALLVRCRQMTVYCARKLRTDKSYPELGRTLHRDHTTLVHAMKRAEYRVSHDMVFAAHVNAVIRFFKAREQRWNLS